MKDNTTLTRKPLISVVLITLLVCVMSCVTEHIDMIDCTGITPSYTTDIRPILNASCAKSGCHDAVTQEEGINLSSYQEANAISQENRFLGSIQHKKGYKKMPDDGPKLSESQVQLLTCWVQNGSPQ